MQPFPRWVSWVFVGFLAYIIYIGNQSVRPPESAPTEKPPVEASEAAPREYDALRQLADGDRWFRAINPSYIGTANIKEITIGDGAPVQCGSAVEITLRGTDSNGANFDATHDESDSLKFLVGAAPYDALNEGLIGMKQGGVRQQNAPTKHVYKDVAKRNFDEVKFHITLKTLNATKADALPATAVTLIGGSDEVEPARCGTKIHANVRVFDVSGKRIYKTDAPVSFTLGRHELAQGIDVLARGMAMGEERLFYIPPHYLVQTAKADASLQDLRKALKGNQLLVVQFTRTKL